MELRPYLEDLLKDDANECVLCSEMVFRVIIIISNIQFKIIPFMYILILLFKLKRVKLVKMKNALQ